MPPRTRASRRTAVAARSPGYEPEPCAPLPGDPPPAPPQAAHELRGARALQAALGPQPAQRADPSPPSPAGERRAALLAGSPREVLERIVPGDPLGIRELVAGHLRSECLFLDADRVHLRALARIARHALRRTASQPDLDAWLGAEVVDAAAEILREEAEAPRADPRSAFVEFARPLGLDPEALRRGCAAFHHLPHADRAAFFALLVLGVGLEAHARATQATPSEVGRRARRALAALLHASHPALPPVPPSGGLTHARSDSREESR